MVFPSNSDEANALATKPKKKNDPTSSSLPDFDRLEARIERLAAKLAEIEPAPKPVKLEKQRRMPGRFKGVLVVGPQFFEPLTDDELDEFATE